MAADPQMIVRVAASISDLKASLAEAKSAVDTAGESAKAAGEQFKGMGESWVARVAEGMLLRDAIRAVGEQVKEVILGLPEEAHQLTLLSLQTRINVQDLQTLSAATKEYGVDGEQLGRALFQLQQRIAGGDASVATAYHLMGMSLDEVRGKNAMDLFLTTERGLGRLSGAIQDTAAKDLFGGKLGSSMIAFSSGVDEAIEKAQGLNHASDENVKALDEYSKAIDRSKTSLHNFTMEIEGGSAQGFNTLVDAVGKGASKWDIFKAMLQDALATQTLGVSVTSNLAKVLDDLNQKTDENAKKTGDQAQAHKEATVAMTAQTAAFHFMAALELDSAKPLLSWQTEYLGHLRDIGELNTKNAAAIGVNADQFKRYEEASKAAAAADKEWAAQQAAGLLEATKLQDEYNTLRVEHGGTSTAVQIAQIHKWADDLTARMQKAGSDTAEFYDKIAKVTAEKLAGVKVDWAALGAASKESLEQTYDKAQATYEAAQSSSLHFSSAAIQHFRDLRDAARAALFDTQAVVESSCDKMNDSVMGIATSFNGWNKALMAVDDSLKKVAADQAALDKGNTLDLATSAQDPVIMELLHDGYSLKNAEAIKLSRQYGFTPQLFDEKGNPETTPSKGERVPGYVDGVMNAPGSWAMVGERGPELMRVPQGADIYPTGTGPGTTIINNYITQPLGSPAAIAAAIDQALTARQLNLGTRFPSRA